MVIDFRFIFVSRIYNDANSNGFRFNNYNAHEMLSAIERAVGVYADRDEWSMLVKRAMNSDFTWSKSAIKYMDIYKTLLNW